MGFYQLSKEERLNRVAEINEAALNDLRENFATLKPAQAKAYIEAHYY